MPNCPDCNGSYASAAGLTNHLRRCPTREARQRSEDAARAQRSQAQAVTRAQQSAAQILAERDRIEKMLRDDAEAVRTRAADAEARAREAEARAREAEERAREAEERAREADARTRDALSRPTTVINNINNHNTWHYTQQVCVMYGDYQQKFVDHVRTLPREFWGKDLDGVRAGLRAIRAAAEASSDEEVATITRTIADPKAPSVAVEDLGIDSQAVNNQVAEQKLSVQIAMLEAVKAQVPELATELDQAAATASSVFTM